MEQEDQSLWVRLVRRQVVEQRELMFATVYTLCVIALTIAVLGLILAVQGKPPISGAAVLLALSLVVVALGIRKLGRNVQMLNRKHQRMIDYMEGVREYTVGNIEPLRDTVELLKQVHVAVPPEEVPKADTDTDKPLTTRERDTLLKIIIGMAVTGYKYDPIAAKSPTPAEVSDDLSKLGIDVSDETIRKHLKKAAELLPRRPPKSSH